MTIRVTVKQPGERQSYQRRIIRGFSSIHSACTLPTFAHPRLHVLAHAFREVNLHFTMVFRRSKVPPFPPCHREPLRGRMGHLQRWHEAPPPGRLREAGESLFRKLTRSKPARAEVRAH